MCCLSPVQMFADIGRHTCTLVYWLSCMNAPSFFTLAQLHRDCQPLLGGAAPAVNSTLTSGTAFRLISSA